MSDKEKVWEVYGEKNAYFGVVSTENFQQENINEETISEFFQTGEDYIERIWGEIENNLVKDFKPQRAFDFGCGVGRLTIPIAKRSEKAVGMDISEQMLKESENNCQKFGIKNTEFVLSDETLSKVSGEFDFVHSFIVLQHINPKIGVGIFRRMVEMLSENGIGVLHVQYANTVSSFAQKLRNKIYRYFPFVYTARNIILKQKNEPLIPLYEYDLNELFQILQANDCHNCLIRFSRHGIDGVLFIFQKTRKEFY